MSNKVYEIITEKVLERLKQGEIPWHQPWVGGYPKNLVSKKEYRGINTFLLGCQKYSSPYWVSFKQAKELGGSVKAGEKSTMVVFWKQLPVTEQKEDGEVTEKSIPFLRYYRVFNVEQTEGIDPKKIPVSDINPNFHPILACEATIQGMPKRPDIQHRDSRAYYNPKEDFVNMPKAESFEKEEFYYCVLFHELGHSTGHEKRLARKKFNEWAPFGSESYSKEELVAEMTAAFLCGHHHIEMQTLENSVSYIQSWLHKLESDPKVVVLAAAQAQRAADYIRGTSYQA